MTTSASRSRSKGSRALAYIGAVLVGLFILSALQLSSSSGRTSAAESDLIVFNIAATSPERLSQLTNDKLEILRNDARRATNMRDTDQDLAAAAVAKIDTILETKTIEQEHP